MDAISFPAYDNYDNYGYNPPPSRNSYYGPSHSRPYSYNPPTGGYYDQNTPYVTYDQDQQPYYSQHGQSQYMRATGAYDDLGIRDGYYDERAMSTRPMTPMTPYGAGQRRRRYSTSSFSRLPSMDSTTYRRYVNNGMRFKFKRRHGFMQGPGISLLDASRSRTVSESDTYHFRDFHSDRSRSFLMQVSWAGYPPMTFDVPVDEKHGRVIMQTLARRIARACISYFQTYRIPTAWDQVELHYLEEVSYGLWQPMLLQR